MIRKLRGLFLESLRCERGSLIVMLAVSAIMLVTAAGAAIDMARAQTLQERMSAALDAAGLAAGATVASAPSTLPGYCSTLGQNTWVGCQAQKYFNANFPSGYLGSNAVTVNASLSSDNITVSLTATTTQNTTLMQVAGINTVSVAASSTVTRATTGMELVLVLDNTGSMSDPVNPSDSHVSKISALKTALTGSGGMLDILYGAGNNTANNLWVGVVPFTYMVNVSNTYTNWVDSSANNDFGPVISGSTCPSYTGPPATTGQYYSSPSRCVYTLSGNSATTNFGFTSNWAGCVDARSATTASSATGESSLMLDESDDPPSASVSGTLFPPLWVSSSTSTSGSSPSYTCSGSQPWNCNTTVATNLPPGCGGYHGTTCTSTTYTSYNVYYPVANSTDTTNTPMGPNTNCTLQTSVLPMTAYRANVDTEVGMMQANGSTMINLGMVWGWRMLSPSWHATSGGFSGWGGEMATAVVTTPTQSYTGLPLNYNTPNMNKVIVLMTDGMNSSSSGGAYQNQSTPTNSQLDTKTLDVCTALKNNGVIIYTIGFGTTDDPADSSSSTYVDGTLLKACASQASYYFLAPTNAQLATAFQTIGAALSNLRVSQ